MMRPASSKGYSANVRIELRIDGQCIPVAQTGGGRLIFDHPVTLPATTGVVVMHVDDNESRWHVTLRPNGQPSRIIEAEFSPS